MSRFPLIWIIAVSLTGMSAKRLPAQSVQELNVAQRQAFEKSANELQAQVDERSQQKASNWVDAAIFAKGLTWALKFDKEFTTADIALLEKAIRRGQERLTAQSNEDPSWTTRKGKVALGYRSIVDGSVQPYGLIVPKSYDGKSPIRLDVVLHGSSRPVGMSELRLISRFDEGDDESGSPPDVSYIELHPLGRVENCYRWSGETDVFEAIEDVCQRYRIDRNRIVLRGMSMGASGTWHLGLKHPDFFVALGPYCGYVDTHKFSETPIPTFVRVKQLPDHQERGLHMLDSIDYAANARMIPAIGCMGEKDIFFQAHVLMAEAMQKEGLELINLISPGTGHVIDPVTHAEQMRQIAVHVDQGRRIPTQIQFVTWTLKYNRCYWLEILGLDQHYARAELSARFQGDVLIVDEPRNIDRFAIVTSVLPESPKRLRVGNSEMIFPDSPNQQPDRIVLKRNEGNWRIDDVADQHGKRRKSPGLQGPIDDAFTSPFVCVRGTGQPWNQDVHAHALASLNRFTAEWEHYFRGKLPVKNDVDVTDDDIQNRNLILFGDPGSNSLIAKCLSQLPLHWTKDSITLGGDALPSADHMPALIAPNPLATTRPRYVVLNSGHTFRETELSTLNYLLFPRWGDYAVLKLDRSQPLASSAEDHVIRAGYFNEDWQQRDH